MNSSHALVSSRHNSTAAAADTGAGGELEVLTSNTLDPIQVLIRGIGVLTPGQRQVLRPGTYAIVASAEGYHPAEAATEILPGVTTAVRFDLLSQDPGYLYVASNPWSEVLLDGRTVGYTLLSHQRIEPGFHTLVLQRSGYVPVDTTVFVSRGSVVRLGPIHLQRRRE